MIDLLLWLVLFVMFCIVFVFSVYRYFTVNYEIEVLNRKVELANDNGRRNFLSISRLEEEIKKDESNYQ